MNPFKIAAQKTKGFLMTVFALSDENAAIYLSNGYRTASGKIVTPLSSLQTIAVLACVRLLAETEAGLPFHVYQEVSDDVKERRPDHWLQNLLDYPNPEMSGMDFRVGMNSGLETWGQSFAKKVRRPNAETLALWPLPHGQVEVKRNDRRALFYRYHHDGTFDDYAAEDVFHLRGFSLDGVNGLSPITQARQGIGLHQATEEYGARYFGNDAKPPVVLEIPNKLNAEQRAQILNVWNERRGEDACGIGISEGGMKVHVLNIPPEDSQFLETRGFNDEQIARLFGVPPHMIGLIGKQTSLGAGVEQMSIGFVTYNEMPRLNYWEQAVRRSLLTPEDRKARIFARHDVRGLLRGDHKSRSEALHLMRNDGVINGDEWRANEDLAPIPDGSGKPYLVNGTMIPIADAAKRVTNALPVSQ